MGHCAFSFLPSSPLLRHTDVSSHYYEQEEGYIFFDKEEKAHAGLITDLQMSADGTFFITSSKDKSAKVRSHTRFPPLAVVYPVFPPQIWSVGPHKGPHGDEEYLTHIKTYVSDPPLNSAAIVPGKPYVRPFPPPPLQNPTYRFVNYRSLPEEDKKR